MVKLCQKFTLFVLASGYTKHIIHFWDAGPNIELFHYGFILY